MTEPKPPDEIDLAFGDIMAETPIEVIKKKTPEGGEKKTDEQIEEENKRIEEENRRLVQQLPPEAQELQKKIEESKPHP